MGDTQGGANMSGQRPVTIGSTAAIPYEEHTQTVYAFNYTVTPESGSEPAVLARKDFPHAIPILVPLKDTIVEDVLVMLDQPETTDTLAYLQLVKCDRGVDPLNPASGETVTDVTGVMSPSAAVAYTPKSMCVRHLVGGVEGWVKGSDGVPTHNRIKAPNADRGVVGEVLWLVSKNLAYDAWTEPTLMSITHRITQHIL